MSSIVNLNHSSVGDFGSWRRLPHMVVIRDSFKSWEEVVRYTTMKVDSDLRSSKIFDLEDTNVDYHVLNRILEEMAIDEPSGSHIASTNFSVSPDSVSKIHNLNPYVNSFFGSSELGMNDVINRLPQFCKDDDISHPVTTYKGLPTDKYKLRFGMGSVYQRNFNNTQSILWLQAGVPIFSNIKKFYSESYDSNLAEAVNAGGSSAMGTLYEGTKFALGLPIHLGKSLYYLIRGLNKAMVSLLSGTVITKYYEFKPTQALYYRYLNGLVATLAINMRLYPMDGSTMSNMLRGYIGGSGGTTGGATGTTASYGSDSGGIPRLLEGNIDMLSILNKRMRTRKLGSDGFIGTNSGFGETEVSASDEAMRIFLEHDVPGTEADIDEEEQGLISGTLKAAANSFVNYALGTGAYIGIRITKASNASESFSNNSGPSEIAQQLDSMAASSQESMIKHMDYSLFGNANSGGLSGVAQAGLEKMKGAMDWVRDLSGVSSIDIVSRGAGYFDIPDVWKDSSFSKNYSFDVPLKAVYGDPMSILSSIYIPLMAIMTFGMPRSIGKNSYTSPFLVQCYNKGMFAVPCGIIENITISRGANEHGWTYGFLPTEVTVSFTIKDLSPVMHMSIASTGTVKGFMDVFTSNSSLQEYLLTLAGLGLVDRKGSTIMNMGRKLLAMTALTRATWLNKVYWGALAGETLPGIIYGVVSRYSGLSNK